MYDELVKRLRNCASSTVEDCDGCPYIGGYNGTYCMNGLITEAADAMPRWIPVTDRLPEKWKWVLVCFDGADVPSTGFVNSAGDWIGEDMYTNYDVTHWMPLPEPPKEES